MRLTDEQRSALAERGFATIAQVLDPAEVADIRSALEDHAKTRVAPGVYGLICHNPWPEVPLLRQTIERRLAPLACAALDVAEVVLFQDIFIGKPPGTDAVQWHQDYSYWPLDRHEGLTMWLALDHADGENGCLRYIPGTQKLGEMHPADFFVGAAQPIRAHLRPLAAEDRADEAVAMPVAAGTLLIHHPLVWHMSPPNVSTRPRHAWSLTWLDPAVRWQPDHAPHPFVHRLQPPVGEPVCGALFPRFTRSAP